METCLNHRSVLEELRNSWSRRLKETGVTGTHPSNNEIERNDFEDRVTHSIRIPHEHTLHNSTHPYNQGLTMGFPQQRVEYPYPRRFLPMETVYWSGSTTYRPMVNAVVTRHPTHMLQPQSVRPMTSHTSAMDRSMLQRELCNSMIPKAIHVLPNDGTLHLNPIPSMMTSQTPKVCSDYFGGC